MCYTIFSVDKYPLLRTVFLTKPFGFSESRRSYVFLNCFVCVTYNNSRLQGKALTDKIP